MNKMRYFFLGLIIVTFIKCSIIFAEQKSKTGINKNPESELFTVRSTDKLYNSAFIGNGEIATMIGPTGYHSGFCFKDEIVNRTIFWAGRRLSNARVADIRIPRVPPEELIGATIPLIRFGKLHRTLKVKGIKTKDDNWEQTLDYKKGTVISVLQHGTIRETTKSLVCLNYNMLVFRTNLKNISLSLYRTYIFVKNIFTRSERLLEYIVFFSVDRRS